MCKFGKQRTRPPMCRALEEQARPTLKGSPGPTASPDWELLKEHLEWAIGKLVSGFEKPKS